VTKKVVDYAHERGSRSRAKSACWAASKTARAGAQAWSTHRPDQAVEFAELTGSIRWPSPSAPATALTNSRKARRLGAQDGPADQVHNRLPKTTW